jgi:4-carboxymuconolactone decarboxylase
LDQLQRQQGARNESHAEDFLAARKVPVFGPFKPMMHSPEVMSIARSTGDYLRYHSAIGNTLSELVILVTAREWSQDYEWYVHQPIALKVGISKDIADAISDGRRPTTMSADEEIVYDYTIELLKNKRVSDPTFSRAEQRFGKKGVVDMVGIIGYYTSLAMQLNTARYQFSGEGPRLSRFPN